MIEKRHNIQYVGDYMIIHSWNCDFKGMELWIYKKPRFKFMEGFNLSMFVARGYVSNEYLKGKCFFCAERCYGQYHDQCEANHLNEQRNEITC